MRFKAGLMIVLILMAVTGRVYSDSLSVATLNLHRFFDTVDDPLRRDKVLTLTSFEKKTEGLARFISNTLACPDVVAVQEVENLSVLKKLAESACPDKKRYLAYLHEGNDISGMDVGFLVSSRLKVQGVRQLGRNIKTKGSRYSLFDRPPLLLALSKKMCGASQLNVVVVHNRSFIGLNHKKKGPRVRSKRLQQARWIGSWVHSWRQSHPNKSFMLLGDFNALPGGKELSSLNKGVENGGDRLLESLGVSIPKAKRYSYIFQGRKQAIDHIFVSSDLFLSLKDVYYTRFNTEKALSKGKERVSDHEAMVAHFDVAVCQF